MSLKLLFQDIRFQRMFLITIGQHLLQLIYRQCAHLSCDSRSNYNAKFPTPLLNDWLVGVPQHWPRAVIGGQSDAYVMHSSCVLALYLRGDNSRPCSASLMNCKRLSKYYAFLIFRSMPRRLSQDAACNTGSLLVIHFILATLLEFQVVGACLHDRNAFAVSHFFPLHLQLTSSWQCLFNYTCQSLS
jgi:hypothetical protein